MGDFLQKLKKAVRIVLYGPALSQSDWRKAGRISCQIIMCEKGSMETSYSSGFKIPTPLVIEHDASFIWYHIAD